MVKARSGAWVFAINDALALEGRPVRDRLPVLARVQAVRALLADRRTPDATLDPCAYEAKPYEPFTADGLRSLARLRDRLDYPVRGLFVRPLVGGLTRFLDFDPSRVKAVVRPEKATEFKDVPPSSVPAHIQDATPSPEEDPLPAPPRRQRMHLRRTPLPDVYDVMEDAHAPSTQAGHAHVPTLAMSIALRAAFQAVPTGATLCRECTFSESFGKWVPILA